MFMPFNGEEVHKTERIPMVSMDLFVAKDVHIDNPKKIEKRKHTKVVIH